MYNDPTQHAELFLEEFVRGTLAEDQSNLVAWHLRSCERCRALRDDLQLLSGIRQPVPASPGPEYFAALPARIRERIAQGGRRRDSRPAVWSRLVLPLAGTAVIVAAIVRFSPGSAAPQFPRNELTPFVESLSASDLEEIAVLHEQPGVAATQLVQEATTALSLTAAETFDAVTETEPTVAVGELSDAQSDELLTHLKERTML